jgi:mannose-6-phosphate isomerase-like protein (cupin superfamily)
VQTPLTSTDTTTTEPDPWGRVSSRAVHPSSHSGEEPLVSVIAAGLAAVSMPWELTSETSTTERTYELLLATDTYDAWLIHWPVGTGLEAHDHGGSTGAFAVVSGVLDEDVERDGETVTRRVRAGQSIAFGGDHVHAVVNRGATGATSVHVYSPPLSSMSFYRESADGGSEIDRVDDVFAAGSASR